MAIAPELRAQILRLYQAELWRVGTIASQLHLHRDTVQRVLGQACVMRAETPLRPSQVDPYLPFIRETLAKFPTLTASRLHAMVRERGYTGGPDHFRHLVACHRPRPAAEAYLRLRTLPGEQAQVDWGHFGHLVVGRAKRPLMAFVMVLSYSRFIFLRFSLNARMDSFLLGHVLAFAAFGGVARVLLYDNLKSAVLERVGDAIRFHPDMLAFAAAHRYEPRPVAVARGNEKGRVERSIRYIRDNFFAARSFTDLDDLNAQALAWCEGPACDRRWPEDDRLTVRQALEVEQASLMKLPEHEYPTAERLEVHAGKTPYVRFDLNDYSIPHSHVRRTLTVLAEPERLRVLDGAAVLATHRRSWDRGAQIEQEEHVRALVDHKRGARAHRATDRLTHAVPAVTELLQRAAARGHNLGSVTLGLSRLLDRYGATPMHSAVIEALARDVPHPNAVRLALERAREAARTPPPVDTVLSERARSLDVTVRTHGLDAYDALRPVTEPSSEPPTQPSFGPAQHKDEP
ncbi:MAG: IS21 family transposase [Burkholderiaceae bacterium]|nr:IS21 family transposase [Burkholderiaceae bacterium]